MLTQRIVIQRASEFYTQMRERYNRNAVAAGRKLGVKVARQELPFSRGEFQAWLMRVMGVQAIPCPLCTMPIDILSVSVDHKDPVSRGGSWGLENLQAICKECNVRKGAFSHDEYVALLAWLSTPERMYLRQELMKRLLDAANGSRERFFRNARKAKERVAR